MSDDAAAVPLAPVSAGALLREARERAGMHIGALSVGLKVPVKKIELLEADRLDLLPDAVFARALASSIARTLKVDPAPILAALPQGQKQDLELTPLGSTASFGPMEQAATAGLSHWIRQPAFLAGVALVVAAAMMIMVPKTETQPDAARSATTAVGTGAVSNTVTGAQLVANASANGASDITNPAASATQALATPIPNSTIATQPPKGESAVEIGSGDEVQAKSGNSGLIQMTASGASWVEVTDANGVVQLRKTLSAGEQATAGGTLPLKVVIGRMDATTVQVRGKPFDVTPFGKDNVARFEVR